MIVSKEQKKWGLRGAILVVVVTGLVVGFWPDSIRVTAESVRVAPLKVTFEEDGVTRYAYRFLMAAPTTGYFENASIKAGEYVSKGTALGTIRSAEGQILDQRQLEIAKARLAGANTKLEQAQQTYSQALKDEAFALSEHKRAEQLLEQEIGSEQQVEQAQLTAEQATTQRKSAEYAVQISEYDVLAAEAALGKGIESDQQDVISLLSPADALILTISDSRSRLVQAGTPLIELANPEKMEVMVDVLSSDAVQIQPGMPIRLLKWGGDEEVAGTVQRVEPGGFRKVSALGVEEQRVNVIAEIPTVPGLGNQYRVVVEFELWQEDDVLQAPSSSLFRLESDWGLFVAEEGRAVLKKVEVGKEAGEWTQILSGVLEGDLVITDPDERIEDGVRILVD